MDPEPAAGVCRRLCEILGSQQRVCGDILVSAVRKIESGVLLTSRQTATATVLLHLDARTPKRGYSRTTPQI
jgi:hypothetical protein